KVAANIVLFRVVVGEATVFPGRGERFELVDRHLAIGCVGRLFALGVDGRAGNLPAAGRKDFPGKLLVGPGEDLVEPVDAPVAEGAVGEVEEVAKAAGMDLGVEWP